MNLIANQLPNQIIIALLRQNIRLMGWLVKELLGLFILDM